LALGGRTVAEWQEVMSSEEFVDWQLYYQLNPFGTYRADLHAGIIASTIANVNAPKGRRYKSKDFMPEFKSRHEEKRMTNEQIVSFFQNMQKGT
jgi:flagellar basal body rod protein FlgB